MNGNDEETAQRQREQIAEKDQRDETVPGDTEPDNSVNNPPAGTDETTDKNGINRLQRNRQVPQRLYITSIFNVAG